MVTRSERLAEFTTEGSPPAGDPMEVLCEDTSGTYPLPFACYWEAGEWHNADTDGQIEACVIGWRVWSE